MHLLSGGICKRELLIVISLPQVLVALLRHPAEDALQQLVLIYHGGDRRGVGAGCRGLKGCGILEQARLSLSGGHHKAANVI